MSSIEIANRIIEIAKAKKLSKMDITRKSGLSYRQVFSIMLGRGNPRYVSLQKIAHALGVEVSELTGQRAMMLQEESVPYITDKNFQQTAPSISEIIDLLSEQLGVPRENVADKISELLKTKEPHEDQRKLLL